MRARVAWKCYAPRPDSLVLEKQHVKVQVQIERTAKALNERDRAGARGAPRHAGLVDQMSKAP
jgi:hypothetical protein